VFEFRGNSQHTASARAMSGLISDAGASGKHSR
jgi:hypothetical protein